MTYREQAMRDLVRAAVAERNGNPTYTRQPQRSKPGRHWLWNAQMFAAKKTKAAKS